MKLILVLKLRLKLNVEREQEVACIENAVQKPVIKFNKNLKNGIKKRIEKNCAVNPVKHNAKLNQPNKKKKKLNWH